MSEIPPTPDADDPLDQLFKLQLGTKTAVPLSQSIAQAIRYGIPGDDPLWNYGTFFFPNRAPQSALDITVRDAISARGTSWSDYAIALVCQAIGYGSTQISSSVEQPLTDNTVSANASKVATEVGMAGIYTVAANPDVQQLVQAMQQASLGVGDFENRVYEEIPGIIIVHNSGLWTDGPLTVYDWYGKHWALAGNKDQLDTFIQTLEQKGLPQLPNLQVDTLPLFNAFFLEAKGPDYTGFPEIQQALNNTNNQPAVYEIPAYFLTQGPGKQYFAGDASCCGEDTEVLMADGTSRAIAEIHPGDYVATPDGPREVLLVWTPPLYGRTLYEFLDPGRGPRLTRAHPIPNPDAGAGGPAHWAVHPPGTRFLLPTLTPSGVGTLAPGSRVETRSTATEDAAPIVRTVDAVRATDMTGHGPVLYDLILAFDAPGRSQYWAGRGGEYCLIASEMPAFEDEPYVAVAVFECLQGLAEHGLPRMASAASPEAAMADLRDTMYKIGSSVLHDALDAGLRAEPSGSDYSLGDAPARIDAFIRGLGQLEPEQVYVIGTLLESAVSALGDALRNVIHLGWRAMPGFNVTSESPSGVVSITVFDLHITARSTLQSDPYQLRVTVAGEGGASATRTASSVRGLGIASFYQRFDLVVDLDASVVGLGPRLLIEIVQEEGGAATAYGEVDVQADRVYQRRIVSLRDQSGNHVGRVHFDVRHLTHDEAEADRSSDWSPERRAALAAHLGRALVKSVLQALATPEVAGRGISAA